MKTLIRLAVALAFVIGAAPVKQHARATLVEARNLAYDANFRNDQAGLRSAIASLESLTGDAAVAAYAHYYASFAYWCLAGSQFQAKNQPGALTSGKLAVEHARKGRLLRPQDAEFQTALANAQIVVLIAQGPPFEPLLSEIREVRKRALALGPRNPRAVMLEAGMIFNDPSEKDGPLRGLARWEEALRLFDEEAREEQADPLAPRWGQALAYGWAAGLYMRMSPPQKEKARTCADIALGMRPDFWWVREQVLPQLRE